MCICTGGASDAIVSVTDIAAPLKMLEISGGLPLAHIQLYIHECIYIDIYNTFFSYVLRWLGVRPWPVYKYIHIWISTYATRPVCMCTGCVSDVIVFLTNIAGPLKMPEILGGLPLAYIQIYTCKHIWIYAYITRLPQGLPLIFFRRRFWRHRLSDGYRGPPKDARNVGRSPVGLYTNIYIEAYMNIYI